MIEVKDLKKSFGTKTILSDVSAVMQDGKCNLIIGSSGSGKTVFMKCLVGLFQPDSGEILYNGKSISTMTREEKKTIRQEIGMLFQGSALFDSLTVEQNIMFPLDMFTKDSYRTKRKRVDEVLNRVALEKSNKKFPSEISGGMKKRVGIARAIVLNPKYLFCDEPNSGLDPQTSMVIEWEGNNKEIIFNKNEKLNAFIFASEFLKDAKDMRMLEEAGKIDNDRDMNELLNNPDASPFIDQK
jgi:phospholipid/cholesterol/gamma-HCH transport system ATP-binding protein